MATRTEIYDFRDKNSLFGKMPPLTDSAIREICQTETALTLQCDDMDAFVNQEGTLLFQGYGKMQVEFTNLEYAVIFLEGTRGLKMFTPEEMATYLKKRRKLLEISFWSIESSGEELILHCFLRNGLRKVHFYISNPEKIIFRWQ